MKLREALRGNLNLNDRLDDSSQTKIRDRFYSLTSLLVRKPKMADGDRDGLKLTLIIHYIIEPSI